jgi:hypothetical protein
VPVAEPARLVLGIELDGEGSHPAAWRRAGHLPAALLDPRRLTRLAQRAERAGLVPDGLDDIVGLLVPALQEHGAGPARYAGATLREHLGLWPRGGS